MTPQQMKQKLGLPRVEPMEVDEEAERVEEMEIDGDTEEMMEVDEPVGWGWAGRSLLQEHRALSPCAGGTTDTTTLP